MDDTEEVLRLRAQLVEAQELVASLTASLHQIICERGQLYNERDVLQTRLKVAELSEELKTLGLLN